MTQHSMPPTRKTIGDRLRAVPTVVLLVIAAVIVALLVVLSLVLRSAGQSTQNAADSANASATAVRSQAAPLAGQVQSVCDQGGAAATQLNSAGACAQASRVQQVIVSGPPGPTGPAGQNGAAGRGIAATHLAGGDLIVTYTDGQSVDVGLVTGPQGATGATGKGISGSAIVGSDLVIAYSDGTSSDVGQVVGPAGKDGSNGTAGVNGSNGTNGSNGCGISSVGESGGNLVVTYDSNCATPGPVTVGPIPQAQACPNGSAPSTTSIVEPSGIAGSTTINGVLVCSG